MRQREAGGAKISAIGLGTWQFGSAEWGYGASYAATTSVELVQRALDLGVTLIDTAEVYGRGNSERLIGGALGDRRDEAFLATKVWPTAVSAAVVEAHGRASAARLGTDHLDLYQVHLPNPLVPLSATMGGMRRLVDDGLVAHVGVSNFSLARWQAADAALGRPVLSNQVCLNLLTRGPLERLVPWAQANGRVVIAYSPLAKGLLSGRYRPGRPGPTGPVRRLNPAFAPPNLARLVPLLDTLADVAGELGATPAQVALAWVLRHPGVVVIPGASSVAQLESNAAAAELALSDGQAGRLLAAAEAYRPFPGVLPAAGRTFRRMGEAAGGWRRGGRGT